MALDIYFAEDIRNALLAANEASGDMAYAAIMAGGNVETLRAYREGYKAALVTIALAFGQSPETLELPTREQEAALPSAPPPRGES